MISVLVADDHGVVRESLCRLLDAEPDLEVCGQAADGREVLEKVERLRPDVVLLDITMPRLGGLEVLERLRARWPSLRVVLLSVHEDSPFVDSAVSLGADGYVLKAGRVSEVLEAIRAAARGESYFSPRIARDLVERLRERPAERRRAGRQLLSNREREVLQLISEGLSAKEIAADLRISTKTVEAHRTNLMRKLGARKATELVRHALRRGLIRP